MIKKSFKKGQLTNITIDCESSGIGTDTETFFLLGCQSTSKNNTCKLYFIDQSAYSFSIANKLLKNAYKTIVLLM